MNMANFKTFNAPMWDQMQVFCKHISDHQIRLILYFNCTLDEKIIKKAVKITLDNNPISFARYIEGKRKAMWKISEPNLDKILSIQISQEPEKLLQEILLKKIDTLAGPQLNITLIRYKTDILVLNFDHAITDAAGVKNFTYQLAENYSYIAQNMSIPKQNYTSRRSSKVLYHKLKISEKWLVFKSAFANKRMAPTFNLQSELDNILYPKFKTLTINPDEFEKIKKFGKQYNATINDMILALLYHTLKKVSYNSNRTNRITYTSDLRIFMEEGEYDTLSNFSAIHSLDIDNTKNDFVSLLKCISSKTQKRKQKISNLTDFPLMAMLFKLISYPKLKSMFHNEFDKVKKGIINASPGITNLGIIEETKIAFDSIIPSQAYMLGTLNHPNLCIVSLSTFKKHLTLSTGSYFSCVNQNSISTILQELKTTISREVLQCSICKD